MPDLAPPVWLVVALAVGLFGIIGVGIAATFGGGLTSAPAALGGTADTGFDWGAAAFVVALVGGLYVAVTAFVDWVERNRTNR